MTPSKVLVFSSLAFLLGVAAGSITLFSWAIVFLGFILGTAFSVPYLPSGNKKAFTISLIIIFALLGFFRASFSGALPKDDNLFFGVARESILERAKETIGGQELAMFSAMVLGEKGGLSQETKEAFNKTGTRHILAISGLHLTIVAVLILNILIWAGLWRKQAFWAALLGILAFVLLVGSPPSAVRAGIMAGLYLLAGHVGRLAVSWRLLLVAATVMVLASPQLLLFSVGFQLSFLAVLGIIFFKPFFDKILKFLYFKPLRDLISLSLAAQLTTWPIIALNFGTLSLVGPVANILVVPMLPIIMTLGLLFIVFGWTSFLVAKVLLWPAWFLLHTINIWISWLSGFSFASVEVGSLGLVLVVLYYAILVGIYYWLKKNAKIQT